MISILRTLTKKLWELQKMTTCTEQYMCSLNGALNKDYTSCQERGPLEFLLEGLWFNASFVELLEFLQLWKWKIYDGNDNAKKVC